MNPINFFKFLEKEKGRPIPVQVKLIYGLPTTPDELNVKNLDLSNTPITSLPQGLKVGGSLNLWKTKITSLPQGLKVEGFLDLTNTPITSLPQGLQVGGTLNLISCKNLTSLPQGLQVREHLYLRNTLITSLPQDLKVEGSLWIRDTPLAKKLDEEIRAMLTTGYIKGGIKR